MKDYNTYQENICNGKYDLYVGLDVDKSSISVSVNDGHEVISSLKMPYDASNLLSFIEKHYPGKKVRFVYEAGPTGFGLYDSIVGAGNDCLVVSPGSIPNAPNNRVKTNRLDSKKLSILLSGNQLKGIHVPTESIRHLRTLVQLRYTYMQDIRAYKCRIKAELLKEGLDFPPAAKGSQWTKAVVAKLRSLDCAVVINYKINSLLNHLECLSKQMLLAEFALKSHVNGNDDLKCCIEYLTSCPGIGWRIACYTLARFGDWRCLGTSKQAGAFFGLVPTENSTGDRTDRGSITKCGDPRLRSMLIQGAWIAIRRDSELKSIYDRICASHSQRVGARVAIVAIARKLTERMHCVLKSQRKYELRAAA
ncbi:MAG: IS110 family transposase [bacterium]